MFHLANPWMLLIGLVPLFGSLLAPKTKVVACTALKVPFFSDMVALVNKHQKISKKRAMLPVLIWLLLTIALAGPQSVSLLEPVRGEGHHIMLALDLSASMEITDMVLNGQAVSRLDVVKQAAKEFVTQRTQDAIGFVLFGSQAYLQTPLTFDKHSILERIDDATPGLAGKSTAIGDAIGLSIKRLNATSKKGNVIILLTDGINNAGIIPPLKAAQIARDSQIKIYTIGLGAAAGLPQTFSNPSAALDERTLKQIAHITHGRYFRATDPKSLQHIYEVINELEKTQQEQAIVRPQKEYYEWFAVLALLIYGYWIKRVLS